MGGRGSKSQIPKGYAFLGKKGKPKEIDVAKTLANPHFFEDKKWQLNCQRCVYAYEMQRRGYDVEAKPRILDGTDTLPRSASPQGWTHVMKGAKLVQMPSRKTAEHMDDQMAQWGDGARAIVKVTWKGGHSGHVFIAERQYGRTIYIDPQVGSRIGIDRYMKDAIKGSTQLMRIDNLEPTPLLEKCVSVRQGK